MEYFNRVGINRVQKTIKNGGDLDFWRWSPGKMKMHTGKDFGRHLMKNQKLKASATYRDRSGKIYGYDFVIPKTDRERFERLHRIFLSDKNNENGTKTMGGIPINNTNQHINTQREG
jgi:hypothetical protein